MLELTPATSGVFPGQTGPTFIERALSEPVLLHLRGQALSGWVRRVNEWNRRNDDGPVLIYRNASRSTILLHHRDAWIDETDLPSGPWEPVGTHVGGGARIGGQRA